VETSRFAEAAQTFAAFVAVEPDYPYAWGQLVHCKMQTCDWKGLTEACGQLLDSVRAGRRVCEPFTLLALPSHSSDQLICGQTFVQDKHPAMPALCGTYDHARIRLAYVSGEFREQATAFLVAELFERHDRERFEVFAVSTGFDDGSGMRARLATAFDVFIDASAKSDYETASLMRDCEIDIAINLNGYFGNERTGVFARRPAPIQVNYLGFPGTMGAAYMDYIVADRCVLPEDERQWFTEQAVYLPDSYQVNDSKRRIADLTPTRREVGLPDEGFVFCCFNNNHKIHPDIFDVWCKLLRQVDSSVLWLIEGNSAVGQNLRREAEQRGIAGARIIFAPRMKLPDHLARHLSPTCSSTPAAQCPHHTTTRCGRACHP
jgi:predicted O-linked N-acetylglucosamine transferase (SPINDLY family)